MQDGDNNLLASYWKGLITVNVPGRGRVATFMQDATDHTLFTAHYGVTFDYGQLMSVDWQGRQPSWFLSSASQAYEDSTQFNLHWSPIESWNDAFRRSYQCTTDRLQRPVQHSTWYELE